MVTLKDIAEKAGVSTASVSRVLNQDASFSIANDTKLKILQTAQELQYKSSHVVLGDMSRSEALGKLAVVMLYGEGLEIVDSYYLTVRVHAKEEISTIGIDAKEFFVPRHSPCDIDFSEFTGILVLGDTEDWYGMTTVRRSIIDAGLPTMLVDFDPCDSEINADCVINDLEGITKKALAHFIKKGFTRIGYIGSDGYLIGGEKQEDRRYCTFRETLAPLSLFLEEYVLQTHRALAEDGYELGCRLAAMQTPPQALFLENDSLAIGMLRALKDKGIKVPDQISLIACNDIPTAKYLSPPLSTVCIHSEMIGRMSVRYLCDRIKNSRTVGLRVVVPSELILRKSCIE